MNIASSRFAATTAPLYFAFDGIHQAEAAGQPVFFDYDMHFTPEGQRVWGAWWRNFVLNRLNHGSDHVAP